MLLSPGAIIKIRKEIEDSRMLWEEFEAAHSSDRFILSLHARPTVRIAVSEQPGMTRGSLAIYTGFEKPTPTASTTFRLSLLRSPHPSGANAGTDSMDSEDELVTCIGAWARSLPDHLVILEEAAAAARIDSEVAALLEPLSIPDERFSTDELAGLHAAIERLKARLEQTVSEQTADNAKRDRTISDLRSRLDKLEKAAPRVTKAAFAKMLLAILVGLGAATDALKKLDQVAREVGLLPPH